MPQAWIAREYDAREHALITSAPQVPEADRRWRRSITRSLVTEAVAEAPDEWLEDPLALDAFGGLPQLKEAYVAADDGPARGAFAMAAGADRAGRLVSP